MTKLYHTDEDDGNDKPVRVPIVLPGTHARLVTGLRRARSERITVMFMTAVSSWSQIRWVSVPPSQFLLTGGTVLTHNNNNNNYSHAASATVSFFLLFPDVHQIDQERV